MYKITTKYLIEMENDQSALLFQKIHDVLCAKDPSKHSLVEEYMIGVKIVLFMHDMKENIDHTLSPTSVSIQYKRCCLSTNNTQ